jgi:hydrogenase maturation factor
VYDACDQYGIAVIGGHTEVTFGLPRPILLGTLVGEVEEDRLVTPQGIRPGDALLLTKGVPIEGTAIVAREFGPRLERSLSAAELEEAAGYLYDPGIGVWHDAQAALQAGDVTAMHDPTEGGLATALWELAEAGQCVLQFAPDLVPISDVSREICRIMGIDPLATIASGALLLSTRPQDAEAICRALQGEGIPCAVIGQVLEQSSEGPPTVLQRTASGTELLPRPARDEIARLFESSP